MDSCVKEYWEWYAIVTTQEELPEGKDGSTKLRYQQLLSRKPPSAQDWLIEASSSSVDDDLVHLERLLSADAIFECRQLAMGLSAFECGACCPGVARLRCKAVTLNYVQHTRGHWWTRWWIEAWGEQPWGERPANFRLEGVVVLVIGDSGCVLRTSLSPIEFTQTDAETQLVLQTVCMQDARSDDSVLGQLRTLICRTSKRSASEASEADKVPEPRAAVTDEKAAKTLYSRIVRLKPFLLEKNSALPSTNAKLPPPHLFLGWERSKKKLTVKLTDVGIVLLPDPVWAAICVLERGLRPVVSKGPMSRTPEATEKSSARSVGLSSWLGAGYSLHVSAFMRGILLQSVSPDREGLIIRVELQLDGQDTEVFEEIKCNGALRVGFLKPLCEHDGALHYVRYADDMLQRTEFSGECTFLPSQKVERVWESPVKVNGSVGEIKIDSSPQDLQLVLNIANFAGEHSAGRNGAADVHENTTLPQQHGACQYFCFQLLSDRYKDSLYIFDRMGPSSPISPLTARAKEILQIPDRERALHLEGCWNVVKIVTGMGPSDFSRDDCDWPSSKDLQKKLLLGLMNYRDAERVWTEVIEPVLPSIILGKDRTWAWHHSSIIRAEASLTAWQQAVKPRPQGKVTASAHLKQFPPSAHSLWRSGETAPQWIEVRYEDTEGIVLDGIEMCHDLGTDSGTEHRVIGQIWVWSKSETSEVKKALAHTFDDKVVDGGVSTFFFPSPMKSVFAVRVVITEHPGEIGLEGLRVFSRYSDEVEDADDDEEEQQQTQFDFHVQFESMELCLAEVVSGTQRPVCTVRVAPIAWNGWRVVEGDRQTYDYTLQAEIAAYFFNSRQGSLEPVLVPVQVQATMKKKHFALSRTETVLSVEDVQLLLTRRFLAKLQQPLAEMIQILSGETGVMEAKSFEEDIEGKEPTHIIRNMTDIQTSLSLTDTTLCKEAHASSLMVPPHETRAWCIPDEAGDQPSAKLTFAGYRTIPAVNVSELGVRGVRILPLQDEGAVCTVMCIEVNMGSEGECFVTLRPNVSLSNSLGLPVYLSWKSHPTGASESSAAVVEMGKSDRKVVQQELLPASRHARRFVSVRQPQSLELRTCPQDSPALDVIDFFEGSPVVASQSSLTIAVQCKQLPLLGQCHEKVDDYRIELLPNLVLDNCVPIDFQAQFWKRAATSDADVREWKGSGYVLMWEGPIDSGISTTVPKAISEQIIMRLKIGEHAGWSDFCVLALQSEYGSASAYGAQTAASAGCSKVLVAQAFELVVRSASSTVLRKVSLTAPYWLVNQTGLPILLRDAPKSMDGKSDDSGKSKSTLRVVPLNTRTLPGLAKKSCDILKDVSFFIPESEAIDLQVLSEDEAVACGMPHASSFPHSGTLTWSNKSIDLNQNTSSICKLGTEELSVQIEAAPHPFLGSILIKLQPRYTISNHLRVPISVTACKYKSQCPPMPDTVTCEVLTGEFRPIYDFVGDGPNAGCVFSVQGGHCKSAFIPFKNGMYHYSPAGLDSTDFPAILRISVTEHAGILNATISESSKHAPFRFVNRSTDTTVSIYQPRYAAQKIQVKPGRWSNWLLESYLDDQQCTISSESGDAITFDLTELGDVKNPFGLKSTLKGNCESLEVSLYIEGGTRCVQLIRSEISSEVKAARLEAMQFASCNNVELKIKSLSMTTFLFDIERLHFYVEGISARSFPKGIQGSRSRDLSIAHIQLDDMNYKGKKATQVVLAPMDSGRLSRNRLDEAGSGGATIPLVQVRVVDVPSSGGDVAKFELLDVLVQHTDLCVTTSFLWGIEDFVGKFLEVLESANESSLEASHTRLCRALTAADVGEEALTDLAYIEHFRVGRLNMRLSVLLDGGSPPSMSDLGPVGVAVMRLDEYVKYLTPVTMFQKQRGIDKLDLSIEGLRFDQEFNSLSGFAKNAIRHFAVAGAFQLGNVVGKLLGTDAIRDVIDSVGTKVGLFSDKMICPRVLLDVGEGAAIAEDQRVGLVAGLTGVITKPLHYVEARGITAIGAGLQHGFMDLGRGLTGLVTRNFENIQSIFSEASVELEVAKPVRGHTVVPALSPFLRLAASEEGEAAKVAKVKAENAKAEKAKADIARSTTIRETVIALQKAAAEKTAAFSAAAT